MNFQTDPDLSDLPTTPDLPSYPEQPTAATQDPLDDEQFKVSVRALVTRARSYMDDEVLPAVERAWRYYRGEVDAVPSWEIGRDDAGNPVREGSAVVIRECSDRTQAMLPELARVFLAGEETVVYTPQAPGDEEGAEQATDYANWTFRSQNDGESLILDGVMDWAIKFAAYKALWTTDERRQERQFSGISEPVLMALQQEFEAEGSTIEALEARPRVEVATVMQPSPDGGAMAMTQPLTVYDGRYTVVERSGKIEIECIPQEEFLLDPDARAVEKALLVGTDTFQTVSDLVAMGVPFNEVIKYKGGNPSDRRHIGNARTGRTVTMANPSVGDESTEYVRTVEAVVQLDRDGDGMAERYRVLLLGELHEMVAAAPADDIFHIVASPFRKPHDPIGWGIAESLTDLQDIKTGLVRGMLNSLNRANNPRETCNPSDTDAYEDLISKFGGPIRASAGSLGVHLVPFVGQQAMPILQFFDDVGAMRTGITPAGQGINADALKGQTADGAAAIVSAPQSRMEYLIREFSVRVMRPLFRAILQLAVTHQDKPATIRLRNKWVEVDPRGWNASMDAEPRVGLGTGTRAERITGLTILLAKQEALLMQGSPLVTLKEYRQSLVDLCEALGRKDSGRYFAELTDQQLAEFAQQKAQAAQQAQQLPMMLEQAKAQAKAQADMQVEQMRGQLEERITAMELAGKREIEHLKAQLQMAELQQKSTWKMMELERETALERERIINGDPAGNGNIPSMV